MSVVSAEMADMTGTTPDHGCMSGFRDFVELATSAPTRVGHPPYPYQERIAVEGLPDLIEVPTGAGKTAAATLAWLYRLLDADDSTRASTPRRLVLALPTRALIEQSSKVVRGWLVNLGLDQQIGVHTMMGGGVLTSAAQNAWRLDMHRPTIVVCTLDMLVSRVLLRGYGAVRGAYPLDFALLTNDAHIVVDEIQLVPQATATLRQIAAFQKRYGTARPAGMTVMSATVDLRVLDTVDNRYDASNLRVVRLSEQDRATPSLAQRLDARRTVHQLTSSPPTPKDVARLVLENHVADTLTLVVVNTVNMAMELDEAIGKLEPGTPRLLLHSRFRGVERRGHVEQLEALADSGGIVVSTQCIEAGVDISARTLITECAPWPSIIQRAGRCNRDGAFAGGTARLLWFPSRVGKGQPYDDDQLAASARELATLEAEAVTSSHLSAITKRIPSPDLSLVMLRRHDFERLYDTTPDLAGNDLDISGYIRPDRDLDVQLAWVPEAWFRPEADGTKAAVVLPPEGLRCPVSLSAARDFVQGDRSAWVFDPSADRWVPARSRRLRPQDVVLLSTQAGGYRVDRGFDPKSRDEVAHLLPDYCAQEVSVPESGSASEEPGAIDPKGQWVTLAQHLDEAGRHARALATALAPCQLEPAHLRAVYAAAALHDVGKAHHDWQQALRKANPNDVVPEHPAYAKSPGRGALRITRTSEDGKPLPRTGFRHELISIAMLSSEAARAHLESLDVSNDWHGLVRYLVGAHHGHLRMSARDPRWDGRDGGSLFGCVDQEETPPWPYDHPTLTAGRLDLGIFRAGRQDSWIDAAADLLARLGPFRLAYLETLVRMADWRASANHPLAGGE